MFATSFTLFLQEHEDHFPLINLTKLSLIYRGKKKKKKKRKSSITLSTFSQHSQELGPGVARLGHPTSSSKHVLESSLDTFLTCACSALAEDQGKQKGCSTHTTSHTSCEAKHLNQNLNQRVFKIFVTWTSKDATECECCVFIFTCKLINILYNKHFYQLSLIKFYVISSFHTQIPHDRVTHTVLKPIRRLYLLTWDSNSPFPHPDVLHKGTFFLVETSKNESVKDLSHPRGFTFPKKKRSFKVNQKARRTRAPKLLI